MGYSLNKKRGLYEVREMQEGKRTYIGSFKTEVEAMEASANAKVLESFWRDKLDNYDLTYEQSDNTNILIVIGRWFKSIRTKRKLKKFDDILGKTNE